MRLFDGAHRPAFFTFTLCLLGASTALSQVVEPLKLHSILTGTQAGDLAGHSIAGAGDIDGDGFSDVLVGLPEASPNGLAGAGSVILFSGRGGSIIRRIDGPEPGAAFGAAVAVIPDANADGVSDFLVGAPLAAATGLTEAGKVYRLSGVDGHVINVYLSDQDRARFGIAVTSGNDLNGDGAVDYLVGAPGASVGVMTGAGKVFGISGADSSRLFTVRGSQPGEALGTSVVGLPALESGTIPGFAVGSPNANVGNLTAAGRVEIHRSNGDLLLPIGGNEAGAHLGASVGRTSDLSGDGVGELLVGAPDASPRGIINAGTVFVFSPVGGALLLRVDGSVISQRLGVSTVGTADLSSDGVRDIAVGSAGTGSVPGRVGVYSGTSGVPLFERTGGLSDGTGSVIASAGDVDNDGNTDIVFGEPSWTNGSGVATGRAIVLMWDRSTLSVSGVPRRGDRITFTLNAEPSDLYLLIFSVRGGPGSRITPIPFPNAPGNAVALDVGLENLNVTLTLPGLLGTLDGTGRRNVSVRIPSFTSPPLPLPFAVQFITLRGSAAPLKRVSNCLGLVVSQ